MLGTFRIVKEIIVKSNNLTWKFFYSQLSFVFLLPAIQVVFFCVAIGRDPVDLKLAVVNNEIPEMSETQNCTIVEGCDFTNLTCRLFGQIFGEKSLEPLYFDVSSLTLHSFSSIKLIHLADLPSHGHAVVMNFTTTISQAKHSDLPLL